MFVNSRRRLPVRQAQLRRARQEPARRQSQLALIRRVTAAARTRPAEDFQMTFIGRRAPRRQGRRSTVPFPNWASAQRNNSNPSNRLRESIGPGSSRDQDRAGVGASGLRSYVLWAGLVDTYPACLARANLAEADLALRTSVARPSTGPTGAPMRRSGEGR